MKTQNEIIVVDYHKGNLLSVERGIAAAGGRVRVSDRPEDIASAAAIVLPGVGAFADAMDYMDESGQSAALRQAIAEGKPFLGICLGMQLLFARGSEGAVEGRDADGFRQGLGVFDGECVRMPECGLKIPHVGWDQTLEVTAGDGSPACPLFEGVPNAGNYYFTHSYIVRPSDESVVAAWTDYGARFASAVWRDNVFGCQFHPEKSSAKGLQILANFVDIVSGKRRLA